MDYKNGMMSVHCVKNSKTGLEDNEQEGRHFKSRERGLSEEVMIYLSPDTMIIQFM